MAIEINPSTPSSPIPTVNGISVIWLGNWDNARIYRRNEGVFYDGSSYRANTTTTEEPSATATDWDLIAQGTTVDDSTITNHIANTSNPHNVTAAQVGNTTAQWNANQIQGVTVDNSAIANGRILKYNATTTNLEYVDETGGGGGGASTLDDLTDVTISTSTNGQALIYDNATTQWTNQTLPPPGEVNTGANIGTGNGTVYSGKVGTQLQFRRLNAASNKINIANNIPTNNIDFDITEANLNLNNIGGTLGIAKGGTSATSASAARSNLSVPSIADLTSHTGDTNNPHAVTAAQVGRDTPQWNADRIQGVPVQNVIPTNGQVLVYNSAQTRYEPTTFSAGGGKVIQVVRATRNPPWTLNFTGDWQSTGLAVTITPLSATSTLHIMGSLANVVKSVTANTTYYNLEINDGTNGTTVALNIGRRSDAYPEPVPINLFLPAVNTTTRTYTLRLNLFGSGNNVSSSVGTNYLTVMEIAP